MEQSSFSMSQAKCCPGRMSEGSPLISQSVKPRERILKRSCSCEPEGVLCLLDPMTDYDWDNRPQPPPDDLTVTEARLDWKDIRDLLPCVLIVILGLGI